MPEMTNPEPINTMTHNVTINHLTPELRNLLTSCLKWIRRIEDRHETQGAFLDNIDIKPLRKELENVIEGRITDQSAAVIEQVFIASGAKP